MESLGFALIILVIFSLVLVVKFEGWINEKHQDTPTAKPAASDPPGQSVQLIQGNAARIRQQEQELLRLRAQVAESQSQITSLENQLSAKDEEITLQEERLSAKEIDISRLCSDLRRLTSIASQLVINSSRTEVDELCERYGVDKIDIPEGVYFINGTVPVKGTISRDHPYGDFTVYVADRGTKYHSQPYCGNGYLKAVHAYDIIGRKTPCRICGQPLPPCTPEWYLDIKNLLGSHPAGES